MTSQPDQKREASTSGAMTHAPLPNSYPLPTGAGFAGEYPGAAGPAVARSRLVRLLDAGVRSFLDLTTEDDGLVPYAGLLVELARERGIDVVYRRMEIRDLGTPSARDMIAILDHMDAERAAGRPLYVHCWGGIGRTGTVVGCHLVRSGLTGDDALAAVARGFLGMSKARLRRYLGGSPETRAQREMVRTWRESPARAEEVE